MPKIVKVGPNPAYKLPADPRAAASLKPLWDKIKGESPKDLAYATAMENMRLSGGMYAILAEQAAPVSVATVRMPEDMSGDELKLTALQLGVDMKKPMKKADLVAAVRKAMDAVQIVEDDEEAEA